MYSTITYLNSNDNTGLLAFGNGPALRFEENNSFFQIQEFIDVHSGKYIFMNLSYDLKNKIEILESNNIDYSDFPLATFWAPEYVIEVNSFENKYVQGEQCNKSDEFIQSFLKKSKENGNSSQFKLSPRIDKGTYINHVKELKEELQQGNIYEINYCQEFYADNIELEEPISTYFKLNELTKAPFSCYVQFDEFELFSGSPERYIKKEGNKISSQPIKGTQKRGQTLEEDEVLKKKLAEDPKEQAENVMIVDLVRNDLSKIAKPHSVKVDELFGIYTFETVHQMISTISCEVKEGVSFSDILKATFPMGSMTGAPKLNAMKLIEKHEDFKRGIYSGAVGYLKPNGDFDFNVIIRSLIYNRNKKYLSCSVGGAITIKSDPDGEYEECFTKVNAILTGMNA